jgi:aldehyde dehydrogenase (NAD+)
MAGDLLHIGNRIGGVRLEAGAWVEKFDPHSGQLLSRLADSGAAEVDAAIQAAARAFPAWSAETPVARGAALQALVGLMRRDRAALAACVALETGKPPKDADGEMGAAIAQGDYFAGEGMRLHGRSLTSGMPGKTSFTIRQPHGVAGLIVPANTPIANIAWKLFPALICGNTVVLKASEDAPEIADRMAALATEAGIPAGVFNVIQGRGAAGAALVEHPDVRLISFTGSTTVGRWIAEKAGSRLARVSLELGGKNPFVVCDDADMAQAVHWALLSAFSNAGQRCAAGSRILVFRQVYDQFRDAFVAGARALKLGTAAGCDLGPVVSRRQQQSILHALERARGAGATILCGGGAPSDPVLAPGFYIEPTVLDGLARDHELCRTELFGPVAVLLPVDDMADALALANDSCFGLTAAIHTRSIDRAIWFAKNVRSGVANINLGTFGSEPHMPFGGFGDSGNGTREPGAEALDVYSELKNISMLTREGLI